MNQSSAGPTGQKLPYNKNSCSQDFQNQHGIEERNTVCCNALLDQFHPSLSEVQQKRRQLMKDFHHKYIYFFHTINIMSGRNYKSSPELNSPFRYLCQPFPELPLRLPHFLSTLSQASLIPLWLRRCRPPLNSIITAGTGWQFSLPCCNPLFNKAAGRARVPRGWGLDWEMTWLAGHPTLPFCTNTNTLLQVNHTVSLWIVLCCCCGRHRCPDLLEVLIIHTSVNIQCLQLYTNLPLSRLQFVTYMVYLFYNMACPTARCCWCSVDSLHQI